jgi:hypothetical protein
MVVIRQEQFVAFSQFEMRKFEDWMIEHLQKFFPVQFAELGHGAVRQLIQCGIQRAATYDIRSRRDVCKYIDLMVVFGPDFDKDPRYARVGQSLARRFDSGAKMRLAFEAAQQYLGGR